jgi:hypothetical protein
MSTKQTQRLFFARGLSFVADFVQVKMCKWILTRRRTGRGGGRTPGVSAGSDGQTGASLCPIAEANLGDAVQLLRYLFIQFKGNEICARVHSDYHSVQRHLSNQVSSAWSTAAELQMANAPTLLQFLQLKPNEQSVRLFEKMSCA